MKEKSQNKKYNPGFEEIGDVPFAPPDIEIFDNTDDSAIDIEKNTLTNNDNYQNKNTNDSEEITDININLFRSGTIIDELENEKNIIKNKIKAFETDKIINIEKLSHSIDKLTIVQKIKKKQSPSIQNNGLASDLPGIDKNNNFLSINIPNETLKKLPDDFLSKEFGTIDLNEAERIAREDIHSLAEDDLLKELDIDIAPLAKKIYEKNNKTNQKSSINDKSDEPNNRQKNKTEESDSIPNYPEIDTIADNASLKDNNIPSAPADETPENIIIAAEPESEQIEEIQAEEKDNHVLVHEQIEDSENLTENKNILYIDNTDNENPEIFKLENDFHGYMPAGDYSGNSVLLTESSANVKSVSGLIRDNYPAFMDLLKKPENKHFDDDIDFINKSIIKNDEKILALDHGTQPAVNAGKKIQPQFEQIAGLTPDEMNLIEKKLFNIDQNKLNFIKNTKKIVGLDQPEDDIINSDKFKYILPVMNSLKDNEKKSIEDDITGNTALIVEEDVSKIKLKLEDLMEKIIKDTVQDITDRIRIYEEKKENGLPDSEDKEDIKKLLIYLNNLLDRLPDESIKNFAESEYYDLYKKVLNDLEK